MAAGKSEKQDNIDAFLRIHLRIMRIKGTLDALFPTVRAAMLRNPTSNPTTGG
jgi:hypothetical protein